MDRPLRAACAPHQTTGTSALFERRTLSPHRRHSRVVALAVFLATSPTAAGAAAPDVELPTEAAPDTLTMRAALLRALRDSPRLPDSSLELRAREAESLQAGLLPNPAVTTEVEDFAGGGSRNGFNASQTTVSLAQLIELGGKRAARVRLADANADLARWDFESMRMDVLATAAKAFVAALAAQDKLALTDDLRRIAESSVAAVARTVQSGAASPVEEGRAKVLLSQVQIEREQRARELDQARLALAASWGSTVPSFLDVIGDLADVRQPEPLDELWLDVERNPDLARWNTELEQRSATLSLAEAQAIPDVTVSAGGRYYQDEGTAGVVALFSIPLPVFNRNQGAIEAAQSRLDRAKVEQRIVDVSIRSGVAQAYQQLRAAYAQVLELRERTIPQAEAVFRGAQDAYARGLFRYIEVLDAQRTLFQLRASYVDALLAYHTQITDIARLTGRDPSESVGSTSGVTP